MNHHHSIPNITADITGVGADSQCPDHPGAVDADIYCDDDLVGAATLLPRESDGVLDTWGATIHHWADPALIDFLDARQEDRNSIIEAIVDAVTTALDDD